jgi:inner membrane protein
VQATRIHACYPETDRRQGIVLAVRSSARLYWRRFSLPVVEDLEPLDPLTQGLLGGTLALSAARDKESRPAAVAGFVAALLADADVLIGAGEDTLLQVELHRHFTHALIFVPLGALVAAALLWWLLRRHLEFKRIYWYALLGYATAGLLDACTSYGTHLLWPFSDTRVAWSIIAIVDPLFTLLLLIAFVLGLKKRAVFAARAGLALAGVYLSLGLWQHHNALQSAAALAGMRGHEVQRMVVKPTLGNLFLWRSVYASGDSFYVDAIRVGPGMERVYPGSSLRRFDAGSDLPHLPRDSVLWRDIERFARLSDGFVAPDPWRERVLIDVRYSMLPNSVRPMWGLDLDVVSTSQHASFETYRDRPANARQVFTAMLLGRDLPE